MSVKSDKIKETLKATKLRRLTQTCHVYEVKIDKAKLSKSMEDTLIRLFCEAKWFYNYCLSQENINNSDTKIKQIPVKELLLKYNICKFVNVPRAVEIVPTTIISSEHENYTLTKYHRSCYIESLKTSNRSKHLLY